MLELLHPWALLALPLPLAAWWLLPPLPPLARVQAAESVLVLMRGLQAAGSRRLQQVAPVAILAVGWISLVVALAGPVTSIGTLIRPSGHDVIVAIDLSASMGRREASGPGTAFDRYKKAIQGLLERLSPGDRVALIAFGEQAYLIAPLTHDTDALNGYLDELTVGMPGRKTSVGLAIGLSLKTFESTDNGRRTLLILSDGEDNAGDLPATDAALLAQQRGVIVHTVGIAEGENGGGSDVLRQVAEISGGDFSILEADGVLPAPGLADGTADDKATSLPLRRNWSRELLLLAAMMLAGHALLMRRPS